MKLLRLMWILSGLWAAVCLYLSFDFFRTAWTKDTTLLEWGGKLETYFAGVGAMTVGALPLLGTWWAHRFHKSRERIRLGKQRKKIDKRIEKLDRKQAERTATEAS